MEIGFIDYYLDEWHANNYPAFIRKASGGKLAVTRAYAQIDSPLPGGRASAQWAKDMGIPLCDTIEEVVEKSDALIVLSPDNSEMHEALCQLPLRSGKPTYVDKTFAPDGRIARRLFALAAASGTPCYSSSALRYAPEYRAIDREGLWAISSWGPNGLDTYAIHQVEPIVMLMGVPARRVLYVPGTDWYTLAVEFADGRAATISGFMGDSPFTMNISAKAGARVVTAEADFFAPCIESLVGFLSTGKPPVDSAQTLMVMDILGAGAQAGERPGTWVTVES
ncbi:MAG: hypothetical protein FWE77_01805 [Clostridia bacterium]|nr:hypothetical protein [Clostridia bacterium]